MNNKIEMVVFDWAGTMVDFGSQAPVEVFKRTFAAKGIALTKDEINGPMGMEKRAHIIELLKLDSVVAQWEKLFNRTWNSEDVEELYASFEVALFDIVSEYSVPIEHVVEVHNKLRAMGIKIASTTGYTSAMMERVVPTAKLNGVDPEVVVTPDLVDNSSRPEPFMIFECMKRLNVTSVDKVLKVGDTRMDILEGKNAGVKSIGLINGSNLMGLTKEEYSTLSSEELAAARTKTIAAYGKAGADYIIDNMSVLIDIIDEINRDRDK